MKLPHEIRPNAVYDGVSARVALSLTKNTLAREIRLGRLRVARRAGRYWILGEWILEWLRAGEIRRKAGVSDSASSRLANAPVT
jgi:hypothetical protein